NQTWQDVQLSEGAKRVLDEYDAECDDRIRKGESGAQRQLWNRAHLKALRLAGLLAAADRPHAPVVSQEEAMWAVQIVRRDTSGIAERFKEGDVGDGPAAQIAEIKRIVKDYVTRPYKAFEKNKDVKEEWHRDRVVSLAYIQ